MAEKSRELEERRKRGEGSSERGAENIIEDDFGFRREEEEKRRQGKQFRVLSGDITIHQRVAVSKRVREGVHSLDRSCWLRKETVRRPAFICDGYSLLFLNRLHKFVKNNLFFLPSP